MNMYEEFISYSPNSSIDEQMYFKRMSEKNIKPAPYVGERAALDLIYDNTVHLNKFIKEATIAEFRSFIESGEDYFGNNENSFGVNKNNDIATKICTFIRNVITKLKNFIMAIFQNIRKGHNKMAYSAANFLNANQDAIRKIEPNDTITLSMSWDFPKLDEFVINKYIPVNREIENDDLEKECNKAYDAIIGVSGIQSEEEFRQRCIDLCFGTKKENRSFNVYDACNVIEKAKEYTKMAFNRNYHMNNCMSAMNTLTPNPDNEKNVSIYTKNYQTLCVRICNAIGYAYSTCENAHLKRLQQCMAIVVNYLRIKSQGADTQQQQQNPNPAPAPQPQQEQQPQSQEQPQQEPQANGA